MEYTVMVAKFTFNDLSQCMRIYQSCPVLNGLTNVRPS